MVELRDQVSRNNLINGSSTVVMVVHGNKEEEVKGSLEGLDRDLVEEVCSIFNVSIVVDIGI